MLSVFLKVKTHIKVFNSLLLSWSYEPNMYHLYFGANTYPQYLDVNTHCIIGHLSAYTLHLNFYAIVI